MIFVIIIYLILFSFLIRVYISLFIMKQGKWVYILSIYVYENTSSSCIMQCRNKQSTAESRQRKKEWISAESLVAVNWTGNLNRGIPTPKSSSFLRFLSSSVVCSHTFDYIATVMGTARAIKLKQSLNGLVNDIVAFSARLIKFMSRRKFYPETMNVLELRGTFLVSPRCCHVV